MNVGNRKLFSNRDARSKLSSMGGIMASSPELMGEAQRFAVGSKDAVAANNGVTKQEMLDRIDQQRQDGTSILSPLAPAMRSIQISGGYGLDAQMYILAEALSGKYGP